MPDGTFFFRPFGHLFLWIIKIFLRNLRKGVDNVVYKVYNIREAARCCQKERKVKTMKEKMMKYVLERYPKATEFRYVENMYGRELQFLPNSRTIDCYTCIVKNGTMQILREF